VTDVMCGSASKLPLVVLRGFELTEDYLIKNGFRRPILVRCKDGLDLRVPHENFSVHDVEEHVGTVTVRLFCTPSTLYLSICACESQSIAITAMRTC